MNKTGTMEGVRTLAGYADTSSHGRVRFVISLTSNDLEMRFRLLGLSSQGCEPDSPTARVIARVEAGRCRRSRDPGGSTG